MAADQTPSRTAPPADARLPDDSERPNDGIELLDNPLPGWWKWLLLGTIVLSALYYGYHHFGGTGRSMADRYEVALAEHSRLMFAQMGDLGDDKASLVHAMAQPTLVSIGKSVFRSHCVSCHGPQGGGLVGPNLTDDVYKNVSELTDIVRVVRHGAAAGAMPAWNARLDANEIILVSVYVAALRGETPSGPAKGPEGREIEPWPTLDQLPAAPEEQAPAAADDANEQGDAGAALPEQAEARQGERTAAGTRLAAADSTPGRRAVAGPKSISGISP